MADVSQIKLPNNTTYTVKDAYKSGIYTVIGTQTAATGTWTGVLHGVPALYNGLTIVYYLPYAGSGNATLNLTLDNGSKTGAINCYYNGGTRLTTHYAAGSCITMTYYSAGSISVSGTATTDARWVAGQNYDTNTTYSSKTAKSGGTDVSLCTTGEKYTWNNKSNLALGTTATTALKGNATAQDIKYTSGVTTTIYDVVNETQQSVDDIAGEIEHIKSVLLTSSMNCTYADSSTIGYRTTNTDRVQVSTMTGYPTGKTILGYIFEYAYVGSVGEYYKIALVNLNDGYVSANSKVSGTVRFGLRVIYID